jgi:hypothetical protein
MDEGELGSVKVLKLGDFGFLEIVEIPSFSHTFSFLKSDFRGFVRISRFFRFSAKFSPTVSASLISFSRCFVGFSSVVI